MGMMMLGLLIVAGLVGVAVVGLVVFLATRRPQDRQLPPPGMPAPALLASQLAELDRQLATGQLSQADYTTRRSQLLGLPRPEQR